MLMCVLVHDAIYLLKIRLKVAPSTAAKNCLKKTQTKQPWTVSILEITNEQEVCIIIDVIRCINNKY